MKESRKLTAKAGGNRSQPPHAFRNRDPAALLSFLRMNSFLPLKLI